MNLGNNGGKGETSKRKMKSWKWFEFTPQELGCWIKIFKGASIGKSSYLGSTREI